MIDEIQFNEAAHSYSDGTERKYTSVTTLIGKYTNTFDTEFWAMYTAMKDHGYTVKPVPEKREIYCNNVKYKVEMLLKDSTFKYWYAEIIAKWNGLTAEACQRGNITHNALEDSINLSKGDISGNTNRGIYRGGNVNAKTIKTMHDLESTRLQEDYPIVYERLKGYIERGFSIYAEKKVHLPEYSIAGMIDVPLFIGDHFAILDWKTNKNELHKTSGYYKKVKVQGKWVKSKEWVETGETFKYPLDNLEASKFNIYSLQLSLYSYILEQWGYKPLNNHLEIIHFPLDEAPRLIKVPYLRKEVEIMLEHHKQELLNVG